MPVRDASAAAPFAAIPDAQVRALGDAPALSCGEETLSHAAFARRVDLAARHFAHAMRIEAGDRVVWLDFNSIDQLAALFALARLGAALVPLNWRLAPAEWEAVLADCGPVCLLHGAEWEAQARALAMRRGLAAHPVAALRDATVRPGAPAQAHAGAPVLLVYTSGTTGSPKGALHTQGNLAANIAAAGVVQRLQASDRILTVLPLFHVGGLCIQTLPALAAGAHVLLHPRFEPVATLRAIAQARPTLTLQVPATMKALQDHPDWAVTELGSLRAVWAGSSTLAPALVEGFHARGIPVCNVYGATETGPFSIALDATHARSHAGSCGWPAPGVEATLLDAKDGVGEVLVRGANVVARYWPDRPAVDAHGWFHSGDLGTRAEDGSYTIVGRAKDMIISGGENIYPAEIENALLAHPAVADCAVFGVPDAKWGEIPVAAVVLRSEKGLHSAPDMESLLSNWEQMLRAHVQQRLARYKVPQRWRRLDELPKTALGKVRKDALRDQLSGG